MRKNLKKIIHAEPKPLYAFCVCVCVREFFLFYILNSSVVLKAPYECMCALSV